MSKTYNIFISHSWTYDKHYQQLLNLLNQDENFNFKNYSVPKDDPIHNAEDEAELYDAIKNKISSCSVVLMLTGKYSTYSKWINKEIKIAEDEFTSKKSIIGVEYWGAKQTSKPVKDAADELVKWQSKSIIDAIKKIG